jgi:hypothetical protein
MKTQDFFATTSCPNTLARRLRTVCAMRLLPLLLLLPALVQAQDYSYITNNGQITITGYTSSNGVVMIPGTIADLPVASIGDWAFYATSVTNVLIPDSVTNIGDGAFFDCESLTNVTLGSSVTDIGDWTFAFCPSLTSVCDRGNAPNLGGDNVFYGNLATIYYLSGATNWRPMFDNHPAALWNPPVPFNYTTNNGMITITEYTGSGGAVTIPGSINFLPVTSIGNGAFYQCTSLTSVTIPNSVTSIGDEAFSWCESLTNFTIPNSVTNIGDLAFDYCYNLTSITIPSSVTSIGDAFENCGLTSITIPSSVTSIGHYAFAFCESLTNVTIPNSITSIGDEAFYRCYSLTNVTIPNSVTSIGHYAFAFCRSLSSVTIPNSLTNIGDQAFSYCGLTSVTIPNSVTSIGVGAFSNCGRLSGVTIPNSVTSIGGDAFYNCASLTRVYFQGNAPSVDWNVFSGPEGDRAIPIIYYLPGTTGWENFAQLTGLPTVLWNPVDQYTYMTTNGTITITGYIGSDSDVIIPDTLSGLPVTSIGGWAFSYCGLTSVTIPNSVTSIENYAFRDCTNLTGVYFQGNAPTMGLDVFRYDKPTIYYLPETTGWENFSQLTGLPTVLWNPQAQTSDGSFGVRTNCFGFNITGTSNLVVVVESCTNLANPIWSPVGTNTLTGGSCYFSDPTWTNYPIRCYRLRSP